MGLRSGFSAQGMGHHSAVLVCSLVCSKRPGDVLGGVYDRTA